MATAASAIGFPSPATRQPHLSAPRLPGLRLSHARRRLVVRATDASLPTLKTSPIGIVLVDSSEAEKVHRLKTTYLEKIVPILKAEFSYKNIHQVPKIEKVVVNCGIGDARQNAKGLEATMKHIARITGQWPVKTRATKSVSAFKVREGHIVGVVVTLRRNIMYNFLDRLINLALPRIGDFEGVKPNSFDGHGNYSMGFKEQFMFPELQEEPLAKKRGMDVCIKTTAKTDNEAQRLLTLFGMPFAEEKKDTALDDEFLDYMYDDDEDEEYDDDEDEEYDDDDEEYDDDEDEEYDDDDEEYDDEDDVDEP